MAAVYSGIDLHSNNSVVVVKDAGGKVLYRRRLENDLQRIEQALAPFRERLSGVVVESTFNWYWLVDVLMEAGYPVKLANAKNGNRYLAWAFVEAANFAIRYSAAIQRWYHRKQARTNGIVAIKAVAHKLARARRTTSCAIGWCSM